MKFRRLKKRSCPVCDSQEFIRLYEQKFANHFRHNIISCKACGFVFVNNTPNQKYYNTYYREMSKYEVTRDQSLHKTSLKFILAFFRTKALKNISILDIGCSTGEMLHMLQKEGYTNLSGIDPSPECKRMAKKKFRLKIETENIYTFFPKRRYDFIILSAVLEHLVDLQLAVKKIEQLLEFNGHVFISVPDAESFYKKFDEPFGEFSIEHINFFSRSYLLRLLSNFSPSTLVVENNAIFSIWQKQSGLVYSMGQYIKQSEERLRRIEQIIDQAPEKMVVWGAGSLTRRLLRTTRLHQKVVVIVDRDKNLIGESLERVKIVPPSELKKYTEPILVSTFKFKNEIISEIRRRKLRNKIITLN